MRNIFKKISFENIIENLKRINNRFPFSVWIILVLFFIIIWFINFSDNNDSNLIVKVIVTLISAFLLSVSNYIIWESLDFSYKKKNLFQVITLLYSVIFFIFFNWNAENIENVIIIFINIILFLSLIFIAPFCKNIKKDNNNDISFSYFYEVFKNILLSSIIWFIALWWILIAIFTVINLFDLKFFQEEDLIFNTLNFSLCFLAPIYFLSNIPEKKYIEKDTFKENIFINFIIKYIGVGLITVYFIILYSYSIKVLLNFWDWPKWEISWLVISFSSLAYFVYVFSSFLEKKNHIIKYFRKAIPIAVSFQTIMLFYAIFLRINQYDLTINRYLVVIFWIYLLILSLYLIFSKRKDIVFIPAIIAIFTIIISIWPWSVYNLPLTRQVNNLENNLQLSGILKDGKIIPLENENDIDKDLSVEIYSSINYICDFDNCKQIKNIFYDIYTKLEIEDKIEWEKNKENNIKRYKEAIEKYKETDKERVKNNQKLLAKTIKQEYEWIKNWKLIEWIKNELKLISYYHENEYNYFFISEKNLYPLDIKWYSQMIILNYYYYENESIKNAKYDILEEKIIINNEKWEKIDEIDISSFIKNLEFLWTGKIEDKNNMIFENEKYKIIFSNISTINENNDNMNENDIYSNASWFLFIKD